MTFKEYYQKNSSIIHWGLLGLIIGLLPIILMPISWVLGAAIVIPPWFAYSILHTIFFGSAGGSGEYPNLGAFIFSPIFYMAIGLLIGWILSKIFRK